jgi:hypothetical protein
MQESICHQLQNNTKEIPSGVEDIEILMLVAVKLNNLDTIIT